MSAHGPVDIIVLAEKRACQSYGDVRCACFQAKVLTQEDSNHLIRKNPSSAIVLLIVNIRVTIPTTFQQLLIAPTEDTLPLLSWI